MNAVTQPDATTATARAPFKVNPFAGGHNGEVSMQWMNRPRDQRFLSLKDMWASKKQFWDGAWQTRMDTDGFEIMAPDAKVIEDMHKLSIGGIKVDRGETTDTVEVVPTYWAFSQICTLADTPAKLMRELPTQIAKDVINFRMQNARSVEAVKLYGGVDSLYAATGPDYGRIPDHEIIAAVMEIAGDGRGSHLWKIPGVVDWRTHMYDPEAPVTKDSTTLYASERDCFMFLVDDRNPIEVGKLADGSPDLMFRGFYVQNSEVGARSAKIAAFYLRAVCMNRNLWGVEGFEEITIRHSRSAMTRWINEARPALSSFANNSQKKLIEGVTMAKEARLADDDEAALAWLKGRSAFSVQAAKQILETATAQGESVRSVWGMAQAITAAARDLPNTDKRLMYELEARNILNKAAGVRVNA